MASAARARMASLPQGSLGNSLRGGAELHTEGRILVPWANRNFHVANLAVVCAPFGPEQRYPEPVLIIEVLSPSTESDDRGVKLRAYRRLTSVQDILLVASDRLAIEHYSRAGDRWVLSDLGLGNTIRLASVGVELLLDGFYADLGPQPNEDVVAAPSLAARARSPQPLDQRHRRRWIADLVAADDVEIDVAGDRV